MTLWLEKNNWRKRVDSLCNMQSLHNVHGRNIKHDLFNSRFKTLKSTLLENHTKEPFGDIKREFLDNLLRRNKKNTSVSADENYQLKRIATTAYVLLKILFNKCIYLCDLVFKEGNLDREIYIENLYVNKQGCSEFILFHEEVIFIILQFISLTFFFQCINGYLYYQHKRNRSCLSSAFPKR